VEGEAAPSREAVTLAFAQDEAKPSCAAAIEVGERYGHIG